MASLMIAGFDFALRGELALWQSLVVKRSYFGVGSFRLVAARDAPGEDALERDALLYFAQEPAQMLLVEKVTRTRTRVTVDGVPLKGLAKRRICIPPSASAAAYQAFGWDLFTGDAESAYLHYAEANLTNPEDVKRGITRLVLAENQHRGPVLPWQARFDKLHELFEDIGQATGVGWDIRADMSQKQFVFCAWQGMDRTQGTNRAVLSLEVGNVDDFSLTDDASAEVSTVYAGGSGEDEERLILSVGNDSTGVSRREGWADLSGVSDIDMLRAGAQRKLSPAKSTLTVTVRDSGLCQYGRDYDVGDVVTVVADGRQMNARLIGMEETWESGARSLKATLGDAPVTLVEKIRLANRRCVV